ncbi:hypothetical protein H0N96_02940 [Candidatus Micrarchaeota archaeon]|nr:hypothetical protein [Candidatus Micrarchaeota archaeon]
MASVIQVGKKAIRTKGRKASEEVTVTKVIDKNFVMVKGKKGTEKRCNIAHLEFLD